VGGQVLKKEKQPSRGRGCKHNPDRQAWIGPHRWLKHLSLNSPLEDQRCTACTCGQPMFGAKSVQTFGNEPENAHLLAKNTACAYLPSTPS
jgi:hypothetical protein